VIRLKGLVKEPPGSIPFKVGGVAAALRIEMPGGDLHQYGLKGELLDLDEARTAIDPKEVPA
jgi:8-hydroxy-5-deazaflavin:NADPH oxidoreductase